MINRALYDVAFSPEWGGQMRFITGPRQCGKTTLARQKLQKENNENLYYLWDLRSVRNRYKENEFFFTADKMPGNVKSWLCFDEIHKLPRWKNILKGIYDSSFEHYNFIVTGSAKFDITRRAGDSLSGRYFSFHLFPLSLGELNNSASFAKIDFNNAEDFIKQKLDCTAAKSESLSTLLEYSGFPEPFISQSARFHARWVKDYMDTVIKEDISILTRISNKEDIYDLYNLLPEMVGSPISESSLSAHLEISQPTVKNYLKRLEDFYLGFKVHPYARNIKRALIKASKFYLYDWTKIKDPGLRFENYLAVELKILTSTLTEASADNYSLYFIRNKQKEETDFLIVKNEEPWLLLEAKLSDAPIKRHHLQTQILLGGIPLAQICRNDGVCLMQGKNAYRISANRFLI